MKRPQKSLVYIFIIIIVLATAALKYRDFRREKTALDAQREVLDTIVNKQTIMETVQEKATSILQDRDSDQSVVIKQSVDYKVPFTSQAPFAVWDEDHEEFCEEASVVMAAFYKNGKPLSSQVAEEQMQKLKQWEIDNLGEWKSTSAEQTLKMASDYYKMQGRVVYDFSFSDLKKALSDGHIVIVPAAGRKLANPFFKQPGPIYHMLVVRGYDTEFIYTNDPGTKRGENYKYYPEIILNAAADWPGSEQDILDGKTRRAAIVLD